MPTTSDDLGLTCDPIERGEPYDDIKAVYMAKGSFLWGEGRKNGFCVERWEIWRDSVEWVAELERMSDEARVLAKAAGERIRWIESNFRRRKGIEGDILLVM